MREEVGVFRLPSFFHLKYVSVVNSVNTYFISKLILIILFQYLFYFKTYTYFISILILFQNLYLFYFNTYFISKLILILFQFYFKKDFTDSDSRHSEFVRPRSDQKKKEVAGNVSAKIVLK